MKEGRCKKKVGKGWDYAQCSRKAWKDGYCKQHHPDTVVERQKRSQETWKRKQENMPVARLNRELDEKKQQCEELAEALGSLIAASGLAPIAMAIADNREALRAAIESAHGKIAKYRGES